jgi:hypothetical protein
MHSLRIFSIAFSTLAACNDGRAAARSVNAAVAPAPAAPVGPSGAADSRMTRVIQQRSNIPLPSALPRTMLVRTGRASMQVDSLEQGMNRVRELARSSGALVGNTSVQSGRDRLRSAMLELRIPSDRFDDLVAGLRALGKLEAIDVNVADVGEEFVDVTARVANARQLERRLIDLLATRTGKLSDVLEVEHELARVREEIERYEGHLRYLRERAAVSTLAVTVHEPVPVIADHPGTNPIGEAAKQAWRNFVALVATAIAWLGVLVPIGVIATGAVVVGRRSIRTLSSRA